MQFIGLIIAALVGVFIGKDAAKRGMNAWGWGIFTFLIMIIALPIYFITRKPIQDEAPDVDTFAEPDTDLEHNETKVD